MNNEGDRLTFVIQHSDPPARYLCQVALLRVAMTEAIVQFVVCARLLCCARNDVRRKRNLIF
jgi:hypothetical protein